MTTTSFFMEKTAFSESVSTVSAWICFFSSFFEG